MASKNKEPKTRNFRLTLSDDNTHREVFLTRFTRTGLLVTAITGIVVLLALAFSIVALTPLKNLLPGYPDARTQRTAIRNALVIDSLENVVTRWEFYAENMRRVLEGEDPVKIDSLIRSNPSDSVIEADAALLRKQDSLLRAAVHDAEQFGLGGKEGDKKLPIDGMLFFSPLKGVVSQGYEPTVHPYIDITAPANSVVMSVLDGTVIYAGWSDDGGHTIAIQHEGDIVSIYKHNEKLLKKVGDKVTAGGSIALVGNTGSLTTGDHLHFELWYKGNAIDPTKYIKF